MILNNFEFRLTQVYTYHQLKLSGSRVKTCYCKFFKVVEGMQGNAFGKVRYLFCSKMFLQLHQIPPKLCSSLQVQFQEEISHSCCKAL